ncbi:MAG: hypothetical protein CBC29_08405 [Methylococcaceae bacterium TMED69]|nr:MAG: hypothetical protein CBC29_08405 [Methylococcaceae bacterium TMED69]|tara:strand:- start:227 stop:1021 length:795 start_codon:yes stop_codon:yes gene_type:complete
MDLLEEKNGPITTLVFNRPDIRNALTKDMKDSLSSALHRIAQDDTVKVVVLTGKGQHFMAGGDLNTMKKTLNLRKEEIKDYFLKRIYDLNPIITCLQQMPKPVIASVSGAAAGAGVSMALACDLIVAEQSSYFMLGYCKIGTTPDGGATYNLTQCVGIKKAMELSLLGDKVGASTAQQIGIVNYIAKDGELRSETGTLSSRLANGPTRVYARTKRLLYGSLKNELQSQLQNEATSFSECAIEPDFKEGVKAFFDKKNPEFSGSL